MTRVLVCGSRHFKDTKLLYDTLDNLHKNLMIDVIIEGDAKGADRMAGYWAKKNRVDLLVFPANWNKYGKAAGPIRNMQMVKEGKPDIVLAFLAPNSRGTANMIKIAQEANIETIIVNIGGDSDV